MKARLRGNPMERTTRILGNYRKIKIHAGSPAPRERITRDFLSESENFHLLLAFACSCDGLIGGKAAYYLAKVVTEGAPQVKSSSQYSFLEEG